MPGLQWRPFWEGNRAELFATYILSSVAAVVPVPRPVDYGLDLLCTLTCRDGDALYAGKAFGVQVKSANDPRASYGGLSKTGHWKEYELNWLFGQDQPILLCVADLQAWRLRLYSTSRMWWVRWMKGRPGEIVLVPDLSLDDFQDQTEKDRYVRTPLEASVLGAACGDGYSYQVPLGAPIVDIFLKEQETQDYRDQLRECLNRWVGLDYRNIRHQQSGIPYSVEWADWESNAPPSSSARIWHYWNPGIDKNIAEILGSIAPAITSMLLNLDAQKQIEKLAAIRPVAELARDYDLLDPMGLDYLKSHSVV